MILLRAALLAALLTLPAHAQAVEETTDAPVEAGTDGSAAYDAFLGGRYEEAVAIWLPLATAGEARAQFNLGVMYASGLGLERDMDAAMNWWTLAAGQLHVRAAHNLALAMLAGEPVLNGERQEPDYDEILRYLKIGSNAGYPNSEYTLGKMHEEGLGVEQDPRRAAELYLSAGIKGFARAQFSLAQVYEAGRGMPVDDELALFWLIESAERGHAPAQSALGERFMAGRGVPRDEVQALVWSSLAAEQGVDEANKRRFELSARLPPAQIEEAERRIAEFAPRKGPVLNLPPARTQ